MTALAGRGLPANLLSYPMAEAEDMLGVAANSFSIAFCNFKARYLFKAGYLLAERDDTQILLDPYSDMPFVRFYSTKRVGGAVVNSGAIR